MNTVNWLVLASLVGWGGTVLEAAGPRSVVQLPWVAETEAGSVGALVPLGDRAMFTASDFQHRGALWVTDGTLPGTQLLIDPCSGAYSEYRGVAENAFTTRNPLTYPFFWLRCGVSGEWHLWRTDGTGSGTRRVENLPHLPRLSYLGRAEDESHLWVETAGERSHWRLEADGTAAHRVTEEEFDPEFCRATVATTNPCDLGPSGFRGSGSVAFPGLALYVVQIFDLPRPPRTELWSSDGTAGGTQRLAVLTVASRDDVQFAKAGPVAYFFSGDTLWVTDGTLIGTRAIRPFLPPTSRISLESLRSDGKQALFYVGENLETHLWSSRGTLESTRPVLRACTSSCGGSPSLEGWFAVTDLGVLAWAEEAEETAIYFLDGSGEIRRLLTIPQAPHFRDLIVFGSAAGRVWFSVDEGQTQLYATDGTAAGTRPVGEPGGFIYQVTEVAPDRVVLTGESDASLAHSLLETVTVTDATRQVVLDRDPFSLDQTIQPRDLFAAGEQLFFLAGRHPFEGGEELYRTDGTASGLRRLTQGRAGLEVVQPTLGSLVFTACAETLGRPGPREECRSDTEIYSLAVAGETITALSPGVNFYSDSLLAAHGEAIVHRFRGGLLATDLDGQGMKVLSETDRFFSGGEPPIVTPTFLLTGSLAVRRQTNGTLGEAFDLFLPGTLRGALGERPAWSRFSSETNDVGLFLGTIGADDRLFDEVEIFRGDGPSRLVSTATATFFFTSKFSPPETTEWRLWRTEGTAASTAEVAPGLSWAAVGPETVPFGPLLLFSADSGNTGMEPWVTDGTLEGTRLLADLWLGAADSRPTGFRRVDGRVYFAANDGLHGNELWVTDGSREGTRRLTDLNPGPASSNPREFTTLGDEVFFSASNGHAGAQIWAIPRDSLGDPDPPGGPWLANDQAPGFRFKVRFAGGVAGQAEPSCLPETLCVSGALPGRAEVFLRVVGPRPNGFVWPTLVKFSTASVEVWIEQRYSGVRRYYLLPGARPDFDELPGLFDRDAFRPASAPVEGTIVTRGAAAAEPPSGEWLTSAEVPGFRFKVTIADRPGKKEAACLGETLCVSGAVPGRSEVFVRVVGPKPNGYLWPTIVRFTTSQVRIWIEQTASGAVREYALEGASPGRDELSGRFDRTGFRP